MWSCIKSVQLLCLLLTILIILIASPTALGQGGGSFVRQVSSGTVSNGGTGQVIPYALILVCTSSATGTPCSPTANIYSDQGLTQPLSNPFAADINGVYSFFVATGEYLVQESAPVGAGFSYNESFLIYTNSLGTVSSVGLSMPFSLFTVSGSPVTTSGTLTATLNTQSGNLVFGNCTGSTTTPSFCTITANMLPSTINSTTVSGNLSVTGNETVGGTLGVTGNTALTAGLTVGGTLGVTGNTTLSGTLSSGATTVSSMTNTGSETISGTLGVAGLVTLSATPSSLTTVGQVNVGGNLGVTGNFSVSGASGATITNNLTADGFGKLLGGMETTVIDQYGYPDFAGISACVSNAKSIVYGTAYSNTPALVVFDQTTKGGINLTALSNTGFTVSCTGATDQFAWIAVGNPN